MRKIALPSSIGKHLLKNISLFRVSKNFNFSERYVKPMDVNMQREFWSEPEIKALRDLMRLELQWPEITTQLAQKKAYH